jgi:lipoprotein NlpD
MPHLTTRGLPVAALLMLAACGSEGPVDLDLRNIAGGFSTTEAALAAPARPAPDARGVISYPTYQVVVAQEGDTAAAIAARLGVDANQLAAHNGITPEAPLRRDEILALPMALPGAAAPATAAPVSPGAVATTALAPVSTTPLAPAAATDAVRHQVAPGETAYSIARRYGVEVSALAQWNGLGSDLLLREGQFLLIPPSTGVATPGPTSQPGTGSVTPVPPSAAQPLPQEVPLSQAAAEAAPPPAPQEMAAQQTTASSSDMAMPAQGSIIRAYAPGRNEGVDIGAPAGSPVVAAAAGTVAAVTTNTDGVQIVVVRHPDGLLTVYTNLDNLTVAKDAAVTRGQRIGSVAAGDPSFLHFEVRRGMESQDPSPYLP